MGLALEMSAEAEAMVENFPFIYLSKDEGMRRM